MKNAKRIATPTDAKGTANKKKRKTLVCEVFGSNNSSTVISDIKLNGTESDIFKSYMNAEQSKNERESSGEINSYLDSLDSQNNGNQKADGDTFHVDNPLKSDNKNEMATEMKYSDANFESRIDQKHINSGTDFKTTLKLNKPINNTGRLLDNTVSMKNCKQIVSNANAIINNSTKNQSVAINTKKIISEITQTTAKVSIGNTTISVPLLKPVCSTKIMQDSIDIIKNDNKNKIPLQLSSQKKQGHETHNTTTFNVKCAQHLDAATIASLSQLQVKSAQAQPQTSKNSGSIVQATVLSKKIKLQNYADVTSQAANNISSLREKPSFTQRLCYPKEVSVLCHSTLHNKYFEDESKLSTVSMDPSFSLQKQQELQTNNDNEIELSLNHQPDTSTAHPAANLIACKDRPVESISVGINQNASISFTTDTESSGNSSISVRKAWYPKANPTFCKSEANNIALQNIKARKDITLSSGVTISNASPISSQSKLPLTLRTVSSASIAVNCNPCRNGPVVSVLNVPQTISLTLSKNLTSETSGASGIQNVEHRNILDTLGSTKRNSFSKIIALKSNENHYLLQDINKSSYTTAMNHCSKNVDTQSHREALTKTSPSNSSAVKSEEKYTEYENGAHNTSLKPNSSPKNSKKPQYNGTKISGKYMLSKFDNSGIHTVKSISQEPNPTDLVSPKSEESQNILLKQLLKSTSAITGQGPIISATTSSANSSICSQALSNRKIINVRAPSLGVVSSLEAQLARPVMPPVPTTTAIISPDTETPKSEAFEETNNLKQSVQIISKETSFVSNPAYSNINQNSNTPEVLSPNTISGTNRFGLNNSNPNIDEHYSEDSVNSAESFVSTNSCINKSRNGKNIKTDKKTLSPPISAGNEQQRQKAVTSENVCSDKNVNITDNCNQFVAEQKSICSTSSTTELIDRSENYREKNNKPQTSSPPDIVYTSHISKSTQNSATATKIEYNNNNDKINNSIKLFSNSAKPQNCKENSVEAKQRKKRKRQIHNHIISPNNIRTNSTVTETARKRMRKSSKCDEDYDIFMDHLVNQMRKLSSLEILEPIVCYHKGICPIYGSSDTSKFINKEHQNHALNRFFHDRNPLCINNSNFYEEEPFGFKKKLSESNSIMQNRFYDEEFMPHVSEMEHNKIYKLFNRTKCHSVNNSECFFTKSHLNLKSYFQWNAFSQTNFPGLVEKNSDNQLLGRQSPVVPYIKPLDLRVGSVVSLPSSEGSSDSFKEKTSASKVDEDRNCVTVILTLSSSNVGVVLKDLSNLLNISPISSYKLLDIKNTAHSQKEYCKTKGEHMPYSRADIQNILNGSKRICRNCGLPITNTSLAVCLRNNQNVAKSNLGMISEYSYFCNKTCCLNFKNRLISKSPKDHNFDSLIKKSEFRKQAHQSAIHEPRTKRCRFKYFKFNNIQHGVRMKSIAQKEVEDVLLGLDVAGSQIHSNAFECERKDKITKDNRRCYLCNESGDGASDKTSRLLNFDVDKWVHLNCALWSSGVYETVNGGLRNVEIAVQTGSNQMCSSCQRLGATIKCSKSRCETIYHYPCAKEDQGTFYKENIFHCRIHAHQIKSLKNNELCSLNVRRRVFVDQDENRLVAEYLQRQNLDNLLRVGSIIYLSAGQTLLHQLDAFHNSTGTYPVGYKSIRFYWSLTRPKHRCRYLCTIMEVDKRPQFLIKVLDKIESEYVFKESSPNLVWHRVLELITGSMKHQQKIQIFSKFISGEDFFGLTEPLINYRNPLMEPSLPLHTSGAARTEPQQKHVLGLKKSHTQRTATTTSQRLTNTMVVGEVACPYSKQFVHSKSSQYKKMNQEWRNNVYLARSKIQGLGLYAARDLEKHTMVIEYIGEVIRTEVSEIREKQYAARNRGIYMFRLDEDRIVDATLSGGLARYINHSCNPNCVTEIVDVERELRIIIFAKRRINRGEELSYDYKFDFEDDANKLMCMCGAFNCRKWMN